MERPTDGNDNDTGWASRLAGRALPAAARSAREGDRARRIHPHHAAPRHAARKDLPQHGGARPHQVDRRSAAKRSPASIASSPRGHAQGHSRPLLRPGVPRPADPRHRQGALCRRTRRGGAGGRSACRRGSGAAHRRGLRGAPGDLRRGRGADNKILVHAELKPAGTFADLKHLKGRKGTNIALDYRLRRGDVDKAFATAAHVFEHTFRTQKCLHLALEPYASIGDWGKPASPSTAERRVLRSCAPRSRGCSAGRRTAYASRCPISAAASAASSTSSSKRW